eukprot:TRINITY_DN5410_c0_g1_i1.p1 TRINITY_DN5410_c0_g1~~TRINITY_DN5410_c0_g1_i1.p1  ORF type:complete len:218 (+),score=49.31 TRINITY_DN5410_c0_g1_i1:115-768(+)
MATFYDLPFDIIQYISMLLPFRSALSLHNASSQLRQALDNTVLAAHAHNDFVTLVYAVRFCSADTVTNIIVPGVLLSIRYNKAAEQIQAAWAKRRLRERAKQPISSSIAASIANTTTQVPVYVTSAPTRSLGAALLQVRDQAASLVQGLFRRHQQQKSRPSSASAPQPKLPIVPPKIQIKNFRSRLCNALWRAKKETRAENRMAVQVLVEKTAEGEA